MDSEYLTDEEINAYVQYEAGNREYFTISEEKYAKIEKKIRSSDLNVNRYEKSKQIYNEISEIKEERKFPVMAIAASLLILVVFSAVYYFVDFGDRKQVIVINDVEMPTIAELTARYGINETLDNRVYYPLRSVAISKVLPENNKVFKEEVKFSWDTNSNTQLILKIYDKTEKVLFEKSSEAGEITWKITEDNVYYWSLEDEYEVIHWGKLFGLKN